MPRTTYNRLAVGSNPIRPIMKKYFAIDAGNENYLSDTIYQDDSARTGTLLYTKRTDADSCLCEMEVICKFMKRKSTYSVTKISEIDGPVIIDGVWYEQLPKRNS